MTGKKPSLLKRIRRFCFLKRHKKKNHEKDEKQEIIKDIQYFQYYPEIDAYLSNIVVSRKYRYCIDIATKKVIHKVDSRTYKIEQLEREDIHDLRMRNLDYILPLELHGEPLRKRKEIALEDVDDNEYYYEADE